MSYLRNFILTDDDGDKAEIVCDALSVVDCYRRKTVEGEFYTVSHRFTSVADEAEALLRITTDTTATQIGFAITAGGDCNVDVYEDTTFTADGTTITAYNNLRNSTNTCSSTFRHTPTVDSDGTKIYEDFLAGGEGSKATGGKALPTQVIQLDNSSEYLIKVTNDSGSAITIAIVIELIEV